jgi:hypothetical protein
MNRTSAQRPLLAALMLMGLMLLGVVPGHAQSEPAATDAASELFNAAIAAPSHLSPLDIALTTSITDPPVGVPTLRWAAVPGATMYNVQISVAAGFGEVLVNQNTVATSFTPMDVISDGTFYWRVRTQIGREWGNFSGAWTFHKDWSNEGQIKPVLIAPANDPEGLQPIASFSPEHFSWEPVPGAAAYKLEISVSPDFNDAQLYQQTTLKPHHTPTRQFANNQYYWRVTPIDAGDHAGLPSDVRTFTFAWNHVPTLLTPKDDIFSRFVPRFTWEAVPGASEYILDVSSQEDVSAPVLTIRTANTSYTPEKALANNKDYFWRVRAVNPQGATGPVSETRHFHADWVQPPTLLSPPVESVNHIYPYFSWTPVAGAERYQIQIATGTGFDDKIADVTIYNATGYSQPEWKTLIFGADYFWRVRAIDAQGNTTNWSSEQNPRSFRIVTTPPPNLIYPEPYYAPDGEGMPVHTDRTIAHPIFVWDTTHQWSEENGPAAFLYPDYYRLEVATDPRFTNINFSIESAGQAAAPTQLHPFSNLVDGSLYYWRVTPIRDGNAMALGTRWETRIDRNLPQLPLDNDTIPDLLHPADRFTAVGAAPILGWLPVANANHYEVQISRRRDFSDMGDTIATDSANALFAYYVPWQGRREPMPDGAYWWRVRAKDVADNPVGTWSSTRRFVVARDLLTGNYTDYRVPNPGTLLSTGELYDPFLSLVATSTVTADTPFGLGALHVIQDRSISMYNRNWIVAFGVDDLVIGDVSYAIYLDVNQLENVGGTTDPLGKGITIDPLYLPEYVIYIDRTNNSIDLAKLYKWNGTDWGIGPLNLIELEGASFYDGASQSIQVSFPYATITEQMAQFNGALAVTVFSSGPNDADPFVNSVPTQGSTATLDAPVLISDMPMPLYPFDTPLSNPIVFHELPTLRWRMPHYDTIDGYQIEVARNADFTKDTIVDSWESFESKTASLYGPIPTAFHPHKIAYNDDESYYWRIRYRNERYDPAKSGGYDTGPWSPPMRFKLTSYQVGNPTVTLGNPALGEAAPATPSFTWERVEGAAGYTIQIDNDANMSSPLINKKIDGNSYTAPDTLADGTYYWRVAMRRSSTVVGQWTPIMSFTKTSLVPKLVGPVNDLVVNTQPTFVWTPTFTNTGELHIAAPKYRLQWDDDPQFSSPTTIETEATSYTPLKGQSLNDGTWYWRVAVIDADGERGPDSPAARFYKEYLRPEALSPVQGSSESDGASVSFAWTPLNGAASYKLEIANNEAFDRPIRVTTENTRYTHTGKLETGDYYWRVQMLDKDNKPGPTIPGRFSQGSDSPAVFIPWVGTP